MVLLCVRRQQRNLLRALTNCIRCLYPRLRSGLCNTRKSSGHFLSQGTNLSSQVGHGPDRVGTRFCKTICLRSSESKVPSTDEPLISERPHGFQVFKTGVSGTHVQADRIRVGTLSTFHLVTMFNVIVTACLRSLTASSLGIGGSCRCAPTTFVSLSDD